MYVNIKKEFYLSPEKIEQALIKKFITISVNWLKRIKYTWWNILFK